MRLVEFGPLPTEAEMVMWHANCETICQQIDLRNDGKTPKKLLVTEDRTFMEIWETVVERMPRKSDIFRMAAINSEGKFEKTRVELLQKLFKVVMGILEDSDSETISHLEKSLIIEFLSLYMAENEVEASKMLKLVLGPKKMLKLEDFEGYVEGFENVLEEFLKIARRNREEFKETQTKRETAAMIFESLITFSACFGDVSGFCGFLKENRIRVGFRWMEKIPSFFEEILQIHDYSLLFEVASCLDAFPLRQTFQLRQFFAKSVTDAFVQTARECQHRTKEKVAQSLENSKIFFNFLKETGNEETLKYFLGQQKFEKIGEEAARILEYSTVERLNRSGYFEGLGEPSDELIRQQIQEICEILPHFSKEFVHLALRHYSYITEVTLSSLLQNEELPLELRRIQHLDFSKIRQYEHPTLPPLDFTASDEIEKSIFEERKRKEIEKAEKSRERGPKSSLFSLAPVASASNLEEEANDEAAGRIPPTELRRRAEEYRRKVFAQLEEMRAPTTAFKGMSLENETPNDAPLIPMATSKKYSALNSLKLTQSEKVAIRPTYDKYRYETPNDDGTYDDEYDDELEGREFNIERLNEELETSSEEEAAEGEAGAGSGAAAPSRGARRGGYRGGRGRGGQNAPQNRSNNSNYTGGRDRQMKERHKSDYKQRGADRKNRQMQ